MQMQMRYHFGNPLALCLCDEIELAERNMKCGGSEMKKKRFFLHMICAAAFPLSMGSLSHAAFAQSPAFVRSVYSQAQAQQQPVQKFQGTIVKSKDKYILQDKTSGATYQLDNQDKAKEFAGRDVKVTGTLDPSTNTIQVSDIQAQSGQ
jgi:hypothetical protein